MQKPEPSSAAEVRGGFSVPEARILCFTLWWLCQPPAVPAGAPTTCIRLSWLWRAETQGGGRWAWKPVHSLWHELPYFLLRIWVHSESFFPSQRNVGLNWSSLKLWRSPPPLISILFSSFPCLHHQLCSLLPFEGRISQEMYFCWGISSFFCLPFTVLSTF